MVSLASVILVSAIGLAIFFREDISKTLESFKGFGTVSVFGEGALPTVPAVPEQGVAKEFLDVLGGAGTGALVEQAGAGARIEVDKAIASTTQIFTDPEKSVLGGVFQAGVESRTGVDKAIFDFQQGVENLSEQIKTQVGEVQLGFQQTQTNIADFFSGITSVFGGQTQPKQILSQTTATTPITTTVPFAVVTKATPDTNIITAQQPDLSLVSPFLTPKVEEELTRGELRFGR